MKSRKIALFKGLRDARIVGFASSAADIKKHVEACENKKLVQYHREGKSWPKAKMGGIILNPHIEGADMVRADKNFMPTQVGDHFMFDWDCNVTPFTPQPEDLAKRFVETLDEQVPGFAECCVFEKSCSGALHGAVPCFSGNPKQDLAIYEKVMGVEADRCTLNPSRCFIVTHDLLQGSYDCLFREVPSSVIEGLRKLSQGEEAISEPQMVVEKSVVKIESPTVATGLEVYCEIVSELLGGGQLPAVGTRSNTLYRHVIEISSLGLTSFEQLAELFGKGFDWYGLPESEGKSVVKSALRKDSPERSNECREAVSAVLEKRNTTTVQLSVPTATNESCISYQASEATEEEREQFTPWQANPPQMPSRLPSFFKTYLQPFNAPHIHPSLCVTCMPILAVYLKDVWYRDINNLEKPLNIGHLSTVFAPTSAGKSCCLVALEKGLLPRLKAEDKDGRELIEAYVAEERAKRTTDGAKRPPLVSRLLGENSSSSAVLQRCKDLPDNWAMVQISDEIQCLDTLASGDVSKFLLRAYDGSDYTCERSSLMGEQGSAPLHLNVMTMSQMVTGREWMKSHNAVEVGLANRFDFGTIIEPELWDDTTKLYGDFGRYEEGLAKYLDRLEAAEGSHFNNKTVMAFCEQLQRDTLALATEYSSLSLKNLVRRGIDKLMRKIYIMIILEGRFSPEVKEMARWYWEYALWCTNYCLGHQLEKWAAATVSATGKRPSGPVSLLQRLPATFRCSDLVDARKAAGMADCSEKSAQGQLRLWRHRGLIEDSTTTGVYINLKKKKS